MDPVTRPPPVICRTAGVIGPIKYTGSSVIPFVNRGRTQTLKSGLYLKVTPQPEIDSFTVLKCVDRL